MTKVGADIGALVRAKPAFIAVLILALKMFLGAP